VVFLERSNPIQAEQLADFDASSSWARASGGEHPPQWPAAVVARFGVGYDTVDVAACTEAGIALVITPTACAGRWRSPSSPSCWRSPAS
jgi:lactate dehydrogenase-like 2-hydroxyacid dehydrogenase